MYYNILIAPINQIYVILVLFLNFFIMRVAVDSDQQLGRGHINYPELEYLIKLIKRHM